MWIHSVTYLINKRN